MHGDGGTRSVERRTCASEGDAVVVGLFEHTKDGAEKKSRAE